MTLGEFKKLTEHYSDECTLSWSRSLDSIDYPNLVNMMAIVVPCLNDNKLVAVPKIVLI